MHLDIRTLFFLTSMAALLMSGTMYASIRNNANHIGGMKSWALGIGLQGAGWGLQAFQGYIPHPLGEGIPKTLLLIALAVQYRSLCDFKRVRFPAVLVGGLMVSTIAAFAIFQFIVPSMPGRTIVGSLYAVVLFGMCALALVNDGGATRHPSQAIAGYTFLLCGVVLVFRIAYIVFVSSEMHGLFLPSPMEEVCYLSYYCGVVLISFSYMLMCHEKSSEELGRLATRDSLTECYNRGMIEELLAKELAKAQRHGGALSLLMIDVDHFKQINDHHGHAAGDSALRLVALTAQGSLRLQDALGRYGGEEFLVLLPNTDAAGAMIVAERLRRNIEQLQIKLDSNRFGITVSLGTATALNEAITAEQLTHCADAALYAAKSDGRNRVVQGEIGR